MSISICRHGFVPVRKEPCEASEMTTQLLFGETYQIIESTENWLKIKTDFDGYEGWIDAKLNAHIFENEVVNWRAAKKWIAPGPFVKIIREGDKSPMIISGGSEIYFNGSEMNSFVIGGETYYLTSNYNVNKKVGSIEEIAISFFRSPYLWGGRSFYGIDCSGLAQIVNKIIGKRIPRDASQQVAIGTTVDFVEEAKAGDLAFFDNDEGRITHVGICLGGGEIIHSSGSVKIDKLDHQGIFSQEQKCYTHSLRTIKRVE